MKTRRLGVAILLGSAVAAVAGIFELCEDLPNGGSSVDTCVADDQGNCNGDCYYTVTYMKKDCFPYANPYCGGLSMWFLDEYYGYCDKSQGCICVTPSTPQKYSYTNPCS